MCLQLLNMLQGMSKVMERDRFLAAVREAGIVGEGGAGFPAHVKYAAQAEIIIANGCECEPLLHTDQHILNVQAGAVGRAMCALARVTGASRKVLGIKAKHRGLVERLRPVMQELGIELALLADFYPAGDEQVLVSEITGKSVPPLGLPLHVGVIVANVGTLAAVHAALEGAPVTDKFLTVTGEAAKPGVIKAPIGTSLSECLEACGGALPKNPVFILGGPMMGRLVEGMERLAVERVTKTTGGLIVLPAGHPLHVNAALPVSVLRRRAASACIQCRACTDLCPRRLIGHPFEPHRIMRAFAGGAERSPSGAQVALCSECGVCEHYACPMGMSPRRVNQHVKAALREASLGYEGSREIVPEAARWREYRRIPVARLAARLGLAGYLHRETPFAGEHVPESVEIPLRQHIGAPCIPLVKPGDRVERGDCIGDIPEGALGARLHASVSGRVEETGERVRIRREA